MRIKKRFLAILMGLAVISIGLEMVVADNNCALFVSSCQGLCYTTGQCTSGEYSGIQVGCDNGDSSVSTSYKVNADSYLRNTMGYSQTWTGSAYDMYDYTKRVDWDGDCRWQARRSDDNHYVRFRDGPEPNPQPVPFGNSNLDLWNPQGCVRNTIYAWHGHC